MSAADGLITEVRYENILGARHVTLSGGGIHPKHVLVEIADPGGNVQLKQGMTVSIESNDPRFLGVFEVLAVGRGVQGYKTLRIQAKGKPFITVNDFTAVRGKVFFGEVNVVAEQGGTQSFIAKSDASKVILLGLGAFLIAIGSWFLFDSN